MQILNFARKADEETQLVRVDLVAKEVAKLLRSTVPSSVEIKRDITSDAYAMANPVSIHQIFMNLCTNATFAMNERGVLGIALHKVTLDAVGAAAHNNLPEGAYLRLAVSDTGTGIPQEIIASIFEPFFTTKGFNEGTGMGLSMVQRIVHEYHGDITVESKIGKGSVFTILLPAVEPVETKWKIESDQSLPFDTARILLVDDEAVICKLAARILEHHGYTVQSETSSRTALAHFTAQPDAFDLVITDMTMPEMTGDELIRAMQSIRADIPAILMTGYSKKISDMEIAGLGARAILPKPFEKGVLLRTVHEALQKQQKTHWPDRTVI